MKAPDLLKRFSPTPLGADLCVMGRAVRLETNSSVILQRGRRALGAYTPPPVGRRDLLWRLVGEVSEPPTRAPSPATVIADRGLLFVNFGQEGFIAVDREQREGVGFLSEDCEDFLFPAVFSAVTATALGFAVIQSPCLTYNAQAVLILGPREAADFVLRGLERCPGVSVHARWASFVAAEESGLLVWGEPWLPESGKHEEPVVSPAGDRTRPVIRAVGLAGCICIESPRGAVNCTSPPESHDVKFGTDGTFLATAYPGFGTFEILERLRRLPTHQLPLGTKTFEALHLVEKLTTVTAPRGEHRHEP